MTGERFLCPCGKEIGARAKPTIVGGELVAPLRGHWKLDDDGHETRQWHTVDHRGLPPAPPGSDRAGPPLGGGDCIR